jgi:hypothetical protein
MEIDSVATIVTFPPPGSRMLPLWIAPPSSTVNVPTFIEIRPGEPGPEVPLKIPLSAPEIIAESVTASDTLPLAASTVRLVMLPPPVKVKLPSSPVMSPARAAPKLRVLMVAPFSTVNDEAEILTPPPSPNVEPDWVVLKSPAMPPEMTTESSAITDRFPPFPPEAPLVLLMLAWLRVRLPTCSETSPAAPDAEVCTAIPPPVKTTSPLT